MTSHKETCWRNTDGNFHRIGGPAIVNKSLGYSYWYQHGKLHRTDGPAVVLSGEDGRNEWWYEGQRHRTNGPALVYNNGYRTEWWYLGMLHRVDGPAIKTSHEEMWYFYGNLHRWNGPAIEYSGGRKEWRIGGLLHRTDGPALIIPNIQTGYYYKGLPHRLDGPAIIRRITDDEEHEDYYINGNYYMEERFKKIVGICRKFSNKLKERLRKKYEQELRKTDLCDEVNLYKIIAGYMI